MRYFLSRQCYWPTGNHVVEIAAGGQDRSGPDMLCAVFEKLGEGTETSDPREAVKIAIDVRDAWNRCLGEEGASLSHIEAGYNLDMIMPCEDPTDEQLREWARSEWEIAPKCIQCGALAEETFLLPDGEKGWFCSAHCADEYSWDWEGER